jgi:hypothetical protein
LEPLQEGKEQMLNEIDISKGKVEQISLETEDLLKDHITVQIVETVAEKNVEVKSRVEEIPGRF